MSTTGPAKVIEPINRKATINRTATGQQETEDVAPPAATDQILLFLPLSEFHIPTSRSPLVRSSRTTPSPSERAPPTRCFRKQLARHGNSSRRLDPLVPCLRKASRLAYLRVPGGRLLCTMGGCNTFACISVLDLHGERRRDS